MKLIWLLMAGCTGGDTDPGADTDVDTDSDVGTDTDVGTDADTDSDTTGPSADEQLVRDLVAGSGTVSDVLRSVAWSDGWPVATRSGTYLFVTDDTSVPWFVAGDMNDWTGAAMTMATGFQWAEVAVPAPVGTGYKFTDGATTWRHDPWSRAWFVTEDGRISYVRPSTAAPHMDLWPNLDPSGLWRDVNVWVPAGAGPWPVLYAQDGQSLFFGGGAFGSWHLEDPLATRDILLVAIDNTAARFTEYTHVVDEGTGGGADAYGDLITGTLRPHIEATYATTELDGLLGSSLGGLVTLYLAQRSPSVWDFAGSLSGTMGWGRFSASGPIVQELYVGRSDLDLTIYADSGGDPGGGVCTDPNEDGFYVDDPDYSDNYCTNRQFVDVLAADRWTWDDDLFHWWESGAGHNEAAWAVRVHRPLDAFLGSDP